MARPRPSAQSAAARRIDQSYPGLKVAPLVGDFLHLAALHQHDIPVERGHFKGNLVLCDLRYASGYGYAEADHGPPDMGAIDVNANARLARFKNLQDKAVAGEFDHPDQRRCCDDIYAFVSVTDGGVALVGFKFPLSAVSGFRYFHIAATTMRFSEAGRGYAQTPSQERPSRGSRKQ